jgi:hypothetical protein
VHGGFFGTLRLSDSSNHRPHEASNSHPSVTQCPSAGS